MRAGTPLPCLQGAPPASGQGQDGQPVRLLHGEVAPFPVPHRPHRLAAGQAHTVAPIPAGPQGGGGQAPVPPRQVDLRRIGLPPDEWYVNPAPHGRLDSGRGRLTISRMLPAWGHELIELRSLTEHRRLREGGEPDGPSPAPTAAEGR